MRLLSLAAVFFVLISPAVFAAKRGQSDGSGHVVHDRRAPVAIHRALPPYTGVHVYAGRR